jgi:predicted DNA-binding transcriptional regulator AlpA
MSEPRLVEPAEAYRIVGGLSESTIRRMIRVGTFPRPVVLNRDRHGKAVRVAYIYDELIAWNRQRIEADRGAAA